MLLLIMLAGGCRISHHLLDCPRCLCSAKAVQLSFHCPLKPYFHESHLHYRRPTIHSKSPLEPPIVSFSFSQGEDHPELPSPVAGGIVALGKFDALHIGHRELAIQASKVGSPFLLSFVGMAEVLGWEPRDPVVAKCDRKRVLATWASYCGNVAPAEFEIDFSSVRHLTPRQFVEKLSKELGVCGVVAGENYRFGYKAAGSASELVRLCEEYGMGAYIINSVMDKNRDFGIIKPSDLKDRGQVSSTRVRHALALGDMKYVSELLGRRHRLVFMMKDQEGFTCACGENWVLAPKSCLLNLAPKEGYYENCSLLISDENRVTCRVYIDTTHIRLEMDEAGPYNYVNSQEFPLLSIEFGHAGTDCVQSI